MNKSAYDSIYESLAGKIFQGTNHLNKNLYLYHAFTSPDCKILFYDITNNDLEVCEFSINDLSFLDEISKKEAKKINPNLEETLKRLSLRKFCEKHKVR